MKPAIGAARSRARLQAKVLTPDGGGGFAQDWETYAYVWATLEPGTGTEIVQAGRPETRTTHRLVIRRRHDVSANHRVLLGPRVLAILALVDPGPQSLWMMLLCEEGAPS